MSCYVLTFLIVEIFLQSDESSLRASMDLVFIVFDIRIYVLLMLERTKSDMSPVPPTMTTHAWLRNGAKAVVAE